MHRRGRMWLHRHISKDYGCGIPVEFGSKAAPVSGPASIDSWPEWSLALLSDEVLTRGEKRLFSDEM